VASTTSWPLRAGLALFALRGFAARRAPARRAVAFFVLFRTVFFVAVLMH
jgi:hypothetical protein